MGTGALVSVMLPVLLLLVLRFCIIKLADFN